ncbi:YolD-like family protein [Radiobacillus sp. PE A8.2]|uniref:YolD-like family protein n=1 Tax=Radiobacillus sp. PE A8.2 TaxID=3380349 RepID=UPI00388D687A
MEKVNDRGNLKWTPFMMTEHTEMLNEWYESDKDVQKPIISEDKLEDMQRTIQEAIELKKQVQVFFHSSHRIQLVEGIIVGHGMNRLEIESADGIDYLVPDEIVDISME